MSTPSLPSSSHVAGDTTHISDHNLLSTAAAGAVYSSNNGSDFADAGSLRANTHIPVLTPAAAVAVANVPTLSGAGGATTIASGSNSAALPQATINVASAAALPTSGTINVVTGSGTQAVTYTGTTSTTFTGCAGGTGTMSTGGAVTATFDGYLLAATDMILLTAQTTGSQNGPWTIPAGVTGSWTRPTEFPSASVVRGRTCRILHGTSYSGTDWTLKAPTAGVTVDTTTQTWTPLQPNTTAKIDAYGADPTGTADSTPAFLLAVNALGGATSGSGLVEFGPGVYRVTTGLAVLNSANLGVIGPGAGICTIMHYGSGDCLSATQSVFVQSQATAPSSGRFRGFTIDGTNAAAGAVGFHWGDRSGAVIEDVTVQNYSGTGSIGVHFDARFGWANWNRISIQSDNCTNAFVFDNHTTNGSGWEYNNFDLNCYSFANQNGVIIQTGSGFTAPSIYRGQFGFRGTFSGGGGANTGVCMKFVANGGYITDEIRISCESEATGTMHQSIDFVGTGTGIRGWGSMIFEPGSGSNFVPSNASSSSDFYFDGYINCPGDTYLASLQYPGGRTTIGATSMSAGFGGSGSIFLNGGNFFVYQLVSGAQAIVVASPPPRGMHFKVVLKQPASGSAGTVSSWPCKWPGGTHPTLSTANNAVDVIDVFTPDGTTYYGSLSGIGYA